ncbi:hypothetical protein AK812_SmicGene5212 [Symbiodinium microadriaticum]|uniref:Uncharacterized protein n=1 Tax=Symbiodinium microadriaticum TaxID=2951 RepID=A0A1Q9EUA5_SYMMI|nr:hypothetical protein AK812_SmicGene5212 [Symbiodinium microadriaticum]
MKGDVQPFALPERGDLPLDKGAGAVHAIRPRCGKAGRTTARKSGMSVLPQEAYDEVVAGKTSLLKEHLAEMTEEEKQGCLKETLLRAVYEGKDLAVKALLELRANPLVADGLAHTALHWAARQGHESIALALIKAKAVVQAENRDLITPLHLAAHSNSGSLDIKKEWHDLIRAERGSPRAHGNPRHGGAERMVSYYAPKGKGGAEPFATYSLEEMPPVPDVPGRNTEEQRFSSASSSSVSYYGSLAGRGLKKASVVLSATDAAVREGQSGLENLQRRQVVGSLHMAKSMEELQAVIETRLPEMDTFACTMALHRLARCSHDVDNHVQNGRMVRPEAVNPTRTSLSQREQRLWRASLSASVKQHPSFTVLLARLGNADALKQAQPRQLANVSWALARLSINTAIREQGSAVWAPGDLSRVLWSWAKLAQRDDTFFRRASCLIMSRMPEYTPSQLEQTIWAFAKVAPQDACGHLFPKAADAMLRGGPEGSGLTAYTPPHLAMAVWAFAAVLYRPEELLEQIGKVVPDKLEKLNPQDISNTSWAFTTLLAKDVG